MVRQFPKQHTSNKVQREIKPEPEQPDDDVSLDLSGMKNFFKNVDMDFAIVAAFLLFAMVLVFTVRMLPLQLPVTDSWAASTILQNVQSQVTQSVDQQYPTLPQANRQALIDKQTQEIVTQNQAAFDSNKAILSEQFKSRLRYTGENGKQYTYLGDLDSYFWLRYTRNILRHGNACDTVVNGECRDMYILAPVGGMGAFNPSFHVFAILGLYKFITVFDPLYPLPATSYLVPVIVGILGVIPAFFIGRRLAGNVGGLFAAVLIGIHPLFLSRSLGSDNDVWNVVLPLFIMWMAIEAFEAKNTRGRVIYAILAGAFVGLHAATWEGWWFIYLIVLFAMIGFLIFRAAIAFIREKRKDVWNDTELRNAALVIGVFYVATFLFLLLSGHGTDYYKMPLAVLSASANLDRAIVADYWPNVLTTVAELNKASLYDAINSMGGKLFFFVCLTGMLLLILPRYKWMWKHYALFAIGSAISLYLINTDGITKFVGLGLLILPIGLTLALYLTRDDKIDAPAALIVLVWFLATIYASYSGVRFILLMIPAYGIGFAVVAGRAYEWITEYASKGLKWHRYITNVIVFLLIGLILLQPIKAGRDVANNYIPSISDSWWDALTKINQESKPDAIINSWWDFGHWFKYVADRRVSADGTTQNTHVPRWLGLSLVTPEEHETMGVLRMLDCASDAFPIDEGWQGAYGYALNKTNDSITAQQMIRDLVVLSKDDARAYLAKHGFTKEEQDIMLSRTHCDPPEDFFITSGDMVGKAGVWAHFGLWNFTKAYIAQHSRTLPKEEGIADIQQRFGFSRDQAEKLYYDAKALTDEGQRNAFASPWPGYITGAWTPCSLSANNTAMVCRVNVAVSQQASGTAVIDYFVYNMTTPNASRIVFGFYQNGQRVGENGDGIPSALLLAFDDKMQEIHFDGASGSSLGFLIDVPNKRVLVADPTLLRSMFTQLFFLDGRYSNHFVKFDDQVSFNGERVIVWKVDWEGKAKAGSATAASTAFIMPKQTATNASAK